MRFLGDKSNQLASGKVFGDEYTRLWGGIPRFSWARKISAPATKLVIHVTFISFQASTYRFDFYFFLIGKLTSAAPTRSFGAPSLTCKNSYKQARTLPAEQGVAAPAAGVVGRISVYPHQSFRKQDKQYSCSVIVPLRGPTDDSKLLVQAAVIGPRAVYRADFNFMKAGVMLFLGPAAERGFSAVASLRAV